MTLTVEKSFDWDTFTERFWDRRPVLYKAVDAVPFAEPEVFRAAVLGSRPPHPLAVPGNLQFLVRRRQQTRPHDYLPEPSDGSFDGYEQRMADRLGGRRYALVVHRFHSFSHPLWDRAQRFYAGLWERVGQPTHSAGSTMFHGSYEHSPVGVHQDRFATFMFCVRGTKRMRFWAERPWSDPVHTVLDYQPYLASSFVAEVEPGDLLYWPSRYYHVGESAGDAPATSVNVGIPRREHRPYYEIKDLFRGTRPTASAPLFTPDAAPGGLARRRTAHGPRRRRGRLRDPPGRGPVHRPGHRTRPAGQDGGRLLADRTARRATPPGRRHARTRLRPAAARARREPPPLGHRRPCHFRRDHRRSSRGAAPAGRRGGGTGR
ncbi:hypothetical protein SBADM41S_06325 [Streptomyces badius]